jgi:DNA-binding transcriptional regulator YhcF (GntR family)
VTAPDLTVDLSRPVPPFEQIRGQIAAHIHAGLLATGARLPTMRALAADLGVAVGTVARAYAELESAGLVASRRRTGTVVTGAADLRPSAAQRMRDSVTQLAREARAAGLDVEAAVALLRAAMTAQPAE